MYVKSVIMEILYMGVRCCIVYGHDILDGTHYVDTPFLYMYTPLFTACTPPQIGLVPAVARLFTRVTARGNHQDFGEEISLVAKA